MSGIGPGEIERILIGKQGEDFSAAQQAKSRKNRENLYSTSTEAGRRYDVGGKHEKSQTTRR